MAFQPVPETAEIDIIFTYNGVTCQNVFYARIAGGYILAQLQALADQIDVNWQGNWRSEQPLEVLYVRTEVRGLALENDLVASQNLSAAAGSHVGQALPNNVTFAIKKESGLTGRSARGRCYWVGIPGTERESTDENILLAPYVALLVANVDSIRTSIIAVPGWTPVLVSRFAGGAKRAQGETFPWVSTSNIDRRVDTQRGRLPQ